MSARAYQVGDRVRITCTAQGTHDGTVTKIEPGFLSDGGRQIPPYLWIETEPYTLSDGARVKIAHCVMAEDLTQATAGTHQSIEPIDPAPAPTDPSTGVVTQPNPAPVDDTTCTCHVVEDPWTYYGIAEPGGAMEPDPECPVHFPADTTPSLVQLDLREAALERLAEKAIAWADTDPDHDEGRDTERDLLTAIAQFRAVTR